MPGAQYPHAVQEEGEAAFRDRETRVIASVCASARPIVIATGGGAVLRGENVACLRGASSVVWLPPVLM
jgi:shikimate kinase